jgi:hypothetical protein
MVDEIETQEEILRRIALGAGKDAGGKGENETGGEFDGVLPKGYVEPEKAVRTNKKTIVDPTGGNVIHDAVVKLTVNPVLKKAGK